MQLESGFPIWEELAPGVMICKRSLAERLEAWLPAELIYDRNLFEYSHRLYNDHPPNVDFGQPLKFVTAQGWERRAEMRLEVFLDDLEVLQLPNSASQYRGNQSFVDHSGCEWLVPEETMLSRLKELREQEMREIAEWDDEEESKSNRRLRDLEEEMVAKVISESTKLRELILRCQSRVVHLLD